MSLTFDHVTLGQRVHFGTGNAAVNPVPTTDNLTRLLKEALTGEDPRILLDL